jgi:hypothetical protein
MINDISMIVEMIATSSLLQIVLIYKAPPRWTNPHHRFRFRLFPEMEED